jgi:hypothetical protein
MKRFFASFFKKFFLPAIAAVAVSLVASAAWAEPVKMKTDAATLKRMSVFVSNFTELDMFEIDNRNFMKYGDIVYFGVMHNHLNNPKTVKTTKDGRFAVDYSAVFASAKKYFSFDAETGDARISAKYNGLEFECKGDSFIFKKPANRKIYYARVTETLKDGSLILMKGKIYEKSNPENVLGPFYAYAEPADGTWILVSINRGEHDGSSFGENLESKRESRLGENEILVRSAEEFVAALGPDRTIILYGRLAGSEFDLTEAYLTGATPGDGARWVKVGSGAELVLEGVENLTIRGDESGAGVSLVVGARRPESPCVLTFDGCENIRLEGFMAGHKSGWTGGGVFSFGNCSGVTIERCDIHSADSGLNFIDVKDAAVSDSSISRCTVSNVVIRDSQEITFANCTFMPVRWESYEEDHLNSNFFVGGSRGVLFDKCTFFEQQGVGFEVEDSNRIVVSDAVFKDCYYGDMSVPEGVLELVHPNWIEEKGP